MIEALFDSTRIAPATVAELAAVTALSSDTIRRDIEEGELRAVRRTQKRRTRYSIPIDEARRYIRQLGVRCPASSAS